MNERIKEIEKQCWQSTETDPYALFDVKKFAELIVKECVTNVKDWEKDSRNHISYMLERHFGVEE